MSGEEEKGKGARARDWGDALLALKGRGCKPRVAGAFRSWKRARNRSPLSLQREGCHAPPPVRPTSDF